MLDCYVQVSSVCASQTEAFSSGDPTFYRYTTAIIFTVLFIKES